MKPADNEKLNKLIAAGSPNIRDMLVAQKTWIEGLLSFRDVRKTALKHVIEAAELSDAVCTIQEADAVASEVADCMILLLDICYLYGLDPVDVFYAKLKVNQERTWKSSNGSLTHE